jgi:hypothetical protein
MPDTWQILSKYELITTDSVSSLLQIDLESCRGLRGSHFLKESWAQLGYDLSLPTPFLPGPDSFLA